MLEEYYKGHVFLF